MMISGLCKTLILMASATLMLSAYSTRTSLANDFTNKTIIASYNQKYCLADGTCQNPRSTITFYFAKDGRVFTYLNPKTGLMFKKGQKSTSGMVSNSKYSIRYSISRDTLRYHSLAVDTRYGTRTTEELVIRLRGNKCTLASVKSTWKQPPIPSPLRGTSRLSCIAHGGNADKEL